MIEQIFTSLLEITLAISPIILLLLLASKVLAKVYSAKWRYWVWLVIAVRLLIPANLSFPNAPVTVSAPVQNYQFVPKAPSTIVSSNTVTAIVSPAAPSVSAVPTINLFDIAILVWICGALLFLSFHFFSYFIFLKKAKRWKTPLISTKATEILNDLFVSMNIHRHIPLYLCSDIDSPMMVGFFHPVILLPNQDFTDEQLQMILQHELIHFKRKDLWYKLLLLLANALHWFNPFVYLAAKYAVCDLEIACDEEVLKNNSVNFRKEYGETMLNVMRHSMKRQTMLSTHFSPNKKTIKQRFARILDMKKKRKGIVTLCIALIVVCIMGNFVACHQKRDAVTPAVTSKAASSEEKASSKVSAIPSSAPNSIPSSVPSKAISVIEEKGYSFSGKKNVKIKNRSFVLQDTPKNSVEELVEKDFLYSITGEFDKKKTIWVKDEATQICIENEQKDFDQNRSMQSYTIHQLSILSTDKYADQDKILMESIINQYNLKSYSIVNVIYTQKWPTHAISHDMQQGDGTYSKSYIVGKTAQDPEYKIYDTEGS